MNVGQSGNNGLALQRVTESTVAAIDPRLVSNAAAVVLGDFVVVVDAGMRPYASRLLREALEDTFQRPVKFVCVTHYHADHTFGLRTFQGRDPVRVGEDHRHARAEPRLEPRGACEVEAGRPGWRRVAGRSRVRAAAAAVSAATGHRGWRRPRRVPPQRWAHRAVRSTATILARRSCWQVTSSSRGDSPSPATAPWTPRPGCPP